MKKEYVVYIHSGSSQDSRDIESMLMEDWTIERTDACNSYIVYIFSRVKLEKPIESTVNRVTNEEVVGKKKRK